MFNFTKVATKHFSLVFFVVVFFSPKNRDLQKEKINLSFLRQKKKIMIVVKRKKL